MIKEISQGHDQIPSCTNITEAPTYGQYYVYSSGPKLSHADRPKKKPAGAKKVGSNCHASHAVNIRTKGAHQFWNTMWDPSIYRGTTCKTFLTAELDRFKKKRKEDESLAKKRKYPRSQNKIGGIIRPNTPTDDQSEKVGFGDMGIQTEQFLEEITSETAKKDMCTQFDEYKIKVTDRIYQPYMIGLSQKVQTDESLSFPFHKNVGRVKKELCERIVEQSLLETMEETELESMRKEKRAYIEMRREELYKYQRIANAQRDVAEERALALRGRQLELEIEEEAESRLGAALFSSRCIAGILPITFSVLKIEGFMSETGAQDIYELLLPWMDHEVSAYYSTHKIVSRKILDDLLQKVTDDRETETAAEIWNRLSSTLKPNTINDARSDTPQSFMGEQSPADSPLYEVKFAEEVGEKPKLKKSKTKSRQSSKFYKPSRISSRTFQRASTKH